MVLCVCGAGAGDGSVPSLAAARTTSVVRAGGVSDGSGPSARRAPPRIAQLDSNLTEVLLSL